MEETGAAASIAKFLAELLGEKFAILGVIFSGAVLVYGGVTTLVVVFSLYPIALSLFKKANLPAYLPKVQTVYGPGRYNTEYSDYEKQTGGFYQRTMNGESYRSLYNTTMSFGPKYDGSDVLYWDGKMRPYLPATDNPWKELFRTGWNQTYNLAISQVRRPAATASPTHSWTRFPMP